VKQKPQVLAFPKPLDGQNKLYLRKAGKPIKGKAAYLCTDAAGHHTAVVFGATRESAKAEVWKAFRSSTAKFWR
jgi:hypothetical protein